MTVSVYTQSGRHYEFNVEDKTWVRHYSDAPLQQGPMLGRDFDTWYPYDSIAVGDDNRLVIYGPDGGVSVTTSVVEGLDDLVTAMLEAEEAADA